MEARFSLTLTSFSKLPLARRSTLTDKLLHGAQAITKGVRYVLAGFLYYNVDFFELYDPVFDGHAASADFQTGDLIIGIEVCKHNNDNSKNNDGSSSIGIERSFFPISKRLRMRSGHRQRKHVSC